MSAWTVYWLFQLDSIRVAVGFLSFIGLFGFVGIAYLLDFHKIKWPMFVYTPMWLLIASTSVMLPSTKTMAAIIVLPRIASAENLDTVGRDAGDIYRLAMSRLKDALGDGGNSG